MKRLPPSVNPGELPSSGQNQQDSSKGLARPARPFSPRLMKWVRLWGRSLRLRMLALGLMPLLLAFPIIVGVLVSLGGQRADSILMSKLQGNLVGASTYLDQIRRDLGVRVSEMVKSERLESLARRDPGGPELRELLATTAKGAGLDYLLVVSADGAVMASSTGVERGRVVPDSFVFRQARIGVTTSAFEVVDHEDLPSFSQAFVRAAFIDKANLPDAGKNVPDQALLINAASHFPLSINSLDAMLVGGVLLNNNASLIDYMREIIFPVGLVDDDVEGVASIYLSNIRIAVSRTRNLGRINVSDYLDRNIFRKVVLERANWLGAREFGGQSYRVGYSPIVNGEGSGVGLLGVGIPDQQYRRDTLWLLGAIAGLMALTMLGLSWLFVREGTEMASRLTRISSTMRLVRGGYKAARVKLSAPEDEIRQLELDFNSLIRTIERQEREQAAAQQVIADEALRRRALFEHERDGVVILNSDGSVFEVNPKAASLLARDMAGLAGANARDWDEFLRKSPDGFLEGVGAEGYLYETSYARPDGTEFPVEVAISRADWAGRSFVLLLIRDITDRKDAERELDHYRCSLEQLVSIRTKQLNDRTEQLGAIFALSPDGFVSFDSAGFVLDVNEAFLKITGFLREEVVGLERTAFSAKWGEISSESSPLTSPIRPRVDSADPSASFELLANPVGSGYLYRLDGPGERVVEVTSRTSLSSGVSLILYFRDVTHEIEVDRMKSEFLTTAAHELRTPMASIYGFSKLLLMRNFDDERRQKVTETIVSQSELMIKIINDLLDLARIESRQGSDYVMERIDLRQLLAESIVGFAPPNMRQQPLLECSGEPVVIKADRQKVTQALLNLMSNAYKYSDVGAPVNLHCFPAVVDGREMAVVEVIDRGIGMSAEELERVFERFYRADRSGNIPGTGLGMSIVKEIVELHDGQVDLCSVQGKGTTVRIVLPMVH